MDAEQPVRAMVVDESPTSLVNLLRSYGCEVIAVTSSSAARRLAGRYKPDLLFIDLELQSDHPANLVAQLQCNPDLSETVYIATSTDDDGPYSQAWGFNMDVVKPFEPELVKSFVETISMFTFSHG